MSLITKTYKDFDLNFEAHPVTKDITKKNNEYAIAASIRNLLLTSHYERPFKPDLGSNIKKFLFEPIDNITTSLIQDSIFETLKNYEPRVNILEVIAIPNFDDNGYDIKIVFFVNNTSDPISVSFFLERVR